MKSTYTIILVLFLPFLAMGATKDRRSKQVLEFFTRLEQGLFGEKDFKEASKLVKRTSVYDSMASSRETKRRIAATWTNPYNPALPRHSATALFRVVGYTVKLGHESVTSLVVGIPETGQFEIFDQVQWEVRFDGNDALKSKDYRTFARVTSRSRGKHPGFPLNGEYQSVPLMTAGPYARLDLAQELPTPPKVAAYPAIPPECRTTPWWP